MSSSTSTSPPRSRGGPLPAIILGLFALLACVGMPWVYFVRDYEYVQATAREAQQLALFAGQAFTWLGIALGVVGVAAAATIAAGLWTRWASPRAREAATIVALKRADHMELPDGLTSLTLQAPRDPRPPLPVQVVEPEQPPTPLLEAPPPSPAEAFVYGRSRVEQLVERGDIVPGSEQLLVGYAGQQPRHIRTPEWGLLIVAGQSGKGKSSAAALLIAQAALSGWTIFVCDPSYRRDRSLLRQQLAGLTGKIYRQAVEPAEVAHSVALVTKIARRRIDHGETGAPVLLVVDDFSSVAGRGIISTEALTDLFLTATQASAAGVHTLLIAHDLRGAWFGGPVARAGRDQATHRLIFNMVPTAAAPILPTAEHARQVAVLPVGQALYFDGGEEPTLLQLPHLDAGDLAWAAAGEAPRPYQPWQPSRAAPPSTTASPTAASSAAQLPPTVPLSLPAPRPTAVLDWPTATKIVDTLAAHPGGLDAATIAERTGEALTTVKSRLAELRADGVVDARKAPQGRHFIYSLVRRPPAA